MNTVFKKPENYFFLALALILLSSPALFAQGLDQVNTELQNQKETLVEIAQTVMLIMLIGAFVFLIANLWLKWTQPQNAIVGFLGILLIYTLFTVIF